MQNKKNLILVYLLFLVIGLVLYYPSLNADFWMDDLYRIKEKLPEFNKSYFEVITNILPDRPFLTLSNFLNFHLLGPSPFTFRLVNVILHVTCSFFLFLFLQSNLFFSRKNKLLAIALSFLFLVHTMNTQVIYIIIQRGVILSGICLLALLYFYQKFQMTQKRDYLLLSILFFSVGILSKPNIIFVVLLLFLLDFYKDRLSYNNLKNYLPFLLISCIPIGYYLLLKQNVQRDTSRLNSIEYFIVQTKVLWIYLRQFLFPDNLMIYKKIVYNLPLFKAWNWVYLLSHLVIFGVGLRLFLQKKILGLIVLGFYLSVLPESGFFPIDHVYFEHRYYVPMFFILIGVYSLFSKYKIAPVLVLFLCIPLIWSTYSRNKLFGLEDYNKIYHEKKVKYEFPLAYFVFNWNDKKLLTNFTQEIISKELYPNQIKTIARFSIIESFSEDEKNQIDIDFTNLLKNTDNYKVIEDYTYNWRHIWNFLIYKFFNYLSLKESNEKAVNTIYEIMLKNKHFYDYYQDRTIKTFKLKIYMDRYKILKNKNPEELTEAEKIYLIRYKKVFNPN